MSTTVTLSRKDFCIISKVPSELETNDHTSSEVKSADNYLRYALIRFNSPAATYNYRKILSATLRIPWRVSPYSGAFTASYLTRDFNPLSATYENSKDIIPYANTIVSTTVFAGLPSSDPNPYPAEVHENYVSDIIKHGLSLCPSYSSSGLSETWLGTSPTLSVEFSDSDINPYISLHTESITVSNAQPTVFSAAVYPAGSSILFPSIGSALFEYKALSADDWTTVQAEHETFSASASLQYTFEGKDMPSEDYNYRFRCTLSTGIVLVSNEGTATVANRVLTSTTPARGAFVNREKDTLFSATVCAGASLSEFRWRKKDSETYDTVPITGNSYTLPANTITDGDNYEYNWKAVDRYGNGWTYTNWISFYTTDATPTAKAIAPNGTVVDADKENVFTWQHIISTGSLATASELQKSNDENEWTALTTVAGAATEAVIPAGTFVNGTWYWRVRTSNLDGVQSAWSESAQFLAVATPSTPVITLADSSPRPTVAWQTNEQEAWELSIDGESLTSYGTSKTWKCPKYLDDGEHLVTVRVQSSYGRWSEYASAIFIVTNTPGEAISLSVLTGGASAVLTWTATGYDFFVVYRDGVAIAKVTEKSYVDYFSSGKCSYRVRGCYDDSNNYGLSSAVEAEVYSDSPVIIDAETHELLWLELSEQQHRTFAHSLSRQSASYHVTGRALPSVDITEFRDESLSLSCAFWDGDTDAQRQLESMIGRTVCLKTGTGERAIGALTAVSKSVQIFYTTYQLSVTNSDYEEEVTL